MSVTSIIFFIVGFVLGLLLGIPVTLRIYRAGNLVIDRSDDNTDRYSFELERPLNKLPDAEYISLKIKLVNEPSDILDTQEIHPL